MRTALCSLLFAFVLSGCLSSSPPEGTVSSEDATALRVEYGGEADEVTRVLVERGCTPDALGLYRCDVRGADGRAYVALVAVSDGQRERTLVPDRNERADTRVREVDRSERVVTTGEGDVVNLGPEPRADHRVPAAEAGSRRPVTLVHVRATARLFAGDEPQRVPVRLGDEAAAPLRETLRTLLVDGLPALSASYGE